MSVDVPDYSYERVAAVGVPDHSKKHWLILNV